MILFSDHLLSAYIYTPMTDRNSSDCTEYPGILSMTFAFLREVDLFRCLTDTELHDLAELTTIRHFSKNSVIVLADDEGDEFFIIQKGQVKVSIVHENGGEIILAFLGEGDVFGELSLLDGKPRSANVIALQATELITLRRSHFINLIIRHPRIATALLAELASRLRKTDYQIGDLALLNVTSRVSRAILRLVMDKGIETEEGILLKKRPTHQQLARMAGTTRESVTRVISRLEKEGYIICQGREIMVLKETYEER